LGASRGRLCDSKAFLFNSVHKMAERVPADIAIDAAVSTDWDKKESNFICCQPIFTIFSRIFTVGNLQPEDV